LAPSPQDIPGRTPRPFGRKNPSERQAPVSLRSPRFSLVIALVRPSTQLCECRARRQAMVRTPCRILVKLSHTSAHRFQAEILQSMSPKLGGIVLRLADLHALNALCKRFWIIRRHKDPYPFVDDVFRPATARGHHRNAASERLHEHHPEAFR